MVDSVAFIVHGKPAPQGSKKAFAINGRAVLSEANKRTKPWRSFVAKAAREAMQGRPAFTGPVCVQMFFVFDRPKSHFTSKGTLKTSAPMYPQGSEDIDKLCRAILDGISRGEMVGKARSGEGIVIKDDRQVVEVHAYKSYASPGGYAKAEVVVSVCD